MSDQTQGVVRDLLPATPSVTVAGMTFMGVPLADWVLIATLLYTGVQIVIVIPKAIAVVRSWIRK